MKSELMEKRERGTPLFPLQYYKLDNEDGSFFVPYHWHGEVEILYIIKGNLTLMLNGEDFNLYEGNIYFINQEYLHQYRSKDQSLQFYVYVFPLEHLDFRIEDHSQILSLSPLMKDRLFPFCIYRTDAVYEKVKAELFELIQINQTEPAGYQLQTKACLYKIISYLERNDMFIDVLQKDGQGVRTSKTEEIKNLLLYLRNHYSKPVTLQNAADLMNLSTKYFCTYFKSIFGISFVEYLNHLRIEKACLLLYTTTLPIMEVGLEVGFENFSYFIRTFKKIMNMTPKQYRSSKLSFTDPI